MKYIDVIIFHNLIQNVEDCNENNSPSGEFTIDMKTDEHNDITEIEFKFAKFNDPENIGPKYYRRNTELDIIENKVFGFHEIIESINTDISDIHKEDKTTYSYVIENMVHRFVYNIFYDLYHKTTEIQKQSNLVDNDTFC